MNETTILIAFVAVTSIAVVLQTLILAGMYFSTRKLSEHMQQLAAMVETEVLPLAFKLRAVVDESAPKLQSVLTDVAETSSLVRAKAGELDEAVTAVLAVARTQAANAGVLAERTIQRVDHAAASVQHAVSSPVRHFSALIEGIAAGAGQLMGAHKGQRAKTVPKEETFI